MTNLAPGEYRVASSSVGLGTVECAHVVLDAGRTETLDATLAPATQAISVDVKAVNQTIDLAQSMLQGQITSETIQTIPLNGRKFLELASV